MIDLHCHLLPGIDDGAADLDMALAMARIAVEDGITVTACTPHIYPGLFDNDAAGIQAAVETFRGQLAEAGIPLEITYGADIQVDAELVRELVRATRPTLHGTRYFLYEPPHHTVPPRFTDSLFDCLANGYVPLVTHPERLTWLSEEYYPWFREAARQGAWIQVTAGALTGRFGTRASYWAERMLSDGIVHLLATDAHNPTHRPPLLAEGREAAARLVGTEEAERLVMGRPRAILDNLPPAQVPPPPAMDPAVPNRMTEAPPGKKTWMERLFRRA